ncbi:MAG: AMP-binding protein [Planctomycetes bacterium]|nr:AMP-binding protein [Planctomycetota bacterium]
MATTYTPPTLIEAMRALEDGTHPAPTGGAGLGIYDRRGKNLDRRPYAEVVGRARAWGAWFLSQGVKPGEVVYLCLPTGHELIEAFLGASLVHALPCNVALPRAIGGLDAFQRRLSYLSDRFPGGHLVTTPDVAESLERPAWTPPTLDLTQQAPLDAVDPNSLCYVQLTSGSTSLPKAVAITHANLAANSRGIFVGGTGDATRDTFLGWLPLYHDMGLVGIAFTAFFHGASLGLMRPETFVGSPLRWLTAISEVPGKAVNCAPNFGYQWCVDRIRPDKLKGLDLSPWRLAGVGAEMVRPGTLTAFQERFGPYGFPTTTLSPCYGMAETTLAVTFTHSAREPVLHEGRVSCGSKIEGLEIEIRDSEAGELVEDRVEGEIVVIGSSVFAGYFMDEAATAEALREGRFYSGDLGYLHEGDLYVTGRLKDLIILDGANVAPHELEWVAEQHVDMDGGRAAAFSLEVGTREVPVLIVETKTAPEQSVIDAVKGQAATDIAPLHELVFVRRGCLPKTSSGKVMRGRVKVLYLEGGLDVLWRSRDENATPKESS